MTAPGASPQTWLALALVALAAALLVAPGPVGAPRRLAAAGAGGRTRGVGGVGGAGGVDGAGSRPSSGDGSSPRRLAVLVAVATTSVAAALGGTAGAALGVVLGVVLGVGAGLLAVRLRARAAQPRSDPLAEAGAWDQLAACLRAGLPLDRAVRAVAPLLPAATGTVLVRVADLAALGADPADAWEPALADPATARLARAARRSARSGSAVADVVASVADDVRSEAADVVSARAERAGVLVTGPLGLCFLPAFLALGIVPVVVGLAGPLLEQR